MRSFSPCRTMREFFLFSVKLLLYNDVLIVSVLDQREPYWPRLRQDLW